MKIPPRVKKGDFVGIVAPSSPPNNADVIDQSKEYLEKKGFKVIISKKIRRRNGYLAGTDKERAEDFADIYLNKKVRAVFSLRGGYGSARMAQLLPWRELFKQPKPLVGFSDITVLNSIFLNGDIISYHGPVLTQLLRAKPSIERKLWRSLSEMIMGDWKSAKLFEDIKDAKIISYGKAKGRIIGGNLCTLLSILGTPYEPNFKNSILFLEDVGESPYKVDRLLTQLILSGRLKSIRGIVLGEFTDCIDPHSKKSKEYRQTVDEVLEERLSFLKIPIIMGMPFGHGELNYSFPIGADVILDAKKTGVSLKLV